MTNGEIAEQIAAMRERVARLSNWLRQVSRDSTPADSVSNTDLQVQIVEELQAALDILQTAQDTIDHPAQTSTSRGSRLLDLPPAGELLLREIHHRVKNNLQLVSSLLDLQLMQTEDPTVRELLRDNQSRISLVALVHESLSQSPNLTEINLPEYVRNLTMTVFRIHTIDPESTHLTLEVSEETFVHPDKAIPAGLILNELLSNALRHGSEQGAIVEITVSLQAEPDGQVTLSVTNSGDLLPPDFDLDRVGSLGLQLVNSLVRQIDGTLEVSRGDRTTFTIVFNANLQS